MESGWLPVAAEAQTQNIDEPVNGNDCRDGRKLTACAACRDCASSACREKWEFDRLSTFFLSSSFRRLSDALLPSKGEPTGCVACSQRTGSWENHWPLLHTRSGGRLSQAEQAPIIPALLPDANLFVANLFYPRDEAPDRTSAERRALPASRLRFIGKLAWIGPFSTDAPGVRGMAPRSAPPTRYKQATAFSPDRFAQRRTPSLGSSVDQSAALLGRSWGRLLCLRRGRGRSRAR
jgi:hypothetical protein